MIGRNELAEACRYNDARAEEHVGTMGDGLAAVVRDLGLDMDGVTYVSTQRALRVMGILRHGDPQAIQTTMDLARVMNDPQDRMLFGLIATTWLDGVAAHAQAAKSKGEG